LVSMASFILYIASFIFIPAGTLIRLAVPLLLFSANYAPVLVLRRHLTSICPPILPGVFEGPSAARFKEEFQISNREGEILALLLNGKSNKLIEKELFISANTVRNHIHNIYQKLNVSSRLQLMNLVRSRLGSATKTDNRNSR